MDKGIQEQINEENKTTDMLEATTAKMEIHLKDLVDQHLAVREQEKKLEEKYKTLKAKNDRIEADINRSRRQNNTNSKDFTLIGTSKAGAIDADILCDKIELSAVHDLSNMPATKVKVLVGQLEREKLLLEGQLRNIEWKIDQESKSYHDAKQKLKNAESEIIKANDNLKQYDNRLSPLHTAAQSRASIGTKKSHATSGQ